MAKTRWALALALYAIAAHAQSLPSIRVSQSSVTFSAYVSGDPPPPQSIIVTSTSQTQVRFTVVSNNSNLTVFPKIATTPARIAVAIDQSDLPARIYTALINVTDPSNSYSSIAIPVTYTVEPRNPELEVSPRLVRFASRDQGPDEDETVFVRNSGGGGPIGFSVSVPANSPWIAVSPAQGIVGPKNPLPVKIRVSPQAVKAGFYRTVLKFTSPATSQAIEVPVSLFVGAGGPALALNPRGFQFEVRQGEGTAQTRDVSIFSKGIGSLDWIANVLQGSEWLKVNRTNGTAGAINPGVIRLTTDDTRLPVGIQYGLVRISSPTAINSPLLLPIIINVLDPATPPRVGLSPAGLVFVAVAGQPPPASKTLQIFASSALPVAYQNSSYTNDGAGWLNISSSSGTAATQRPGSTGVSVNHANLTRGIYTGEIAYTFSSADIRAVNVTLVVLPVGARLSSTQRAATGCNPTRLSMTQSASASNFSAAVGWPVPMTVQLADDCGDPVLNGQIVLTYSNGDPAQSMTLTDPQEGSYSATWTPAKDGRSVTVTARAAAPNLPAITTQLTGAVLPNKVPILSPDGTVDNFSFLGGAPLAPGTIAAIFGLDLAPAPRAPGVIPFRTEVDGTRVLVGGVEAPIHFVSGGQINAQIPAELIPNRQYQVLISAGGALTAPDTIDLAAAQPTVQAPAPENVVAAQHANFDTITPALPARPGEAIIVYALGLGQTDPPARSGTASPSNPPARALSQPTVTIGGKPAEIIFAGLTPGFVGLHQINLFVPADATTGNLEITINQNGVTSNPGVLPVRR